MIKTRLVQVGNSQLLIIPDALIQQIGLQNEVLLEVQGDALIIRACPARFGWEEQFVAAKLAVTDEEEKAALRDFTNAP